MIPFPMRVNQPIRKKRAARRPREDCLQKLHGIIIVQSAGYASMNMRLGGKQPFLGSSAGLRAAPQNVGVDLAGNRFGGDAVGLRKNIDEYVVSASILHNAVGIDVKRRQRPLRQQTHIRHARISSPFGKRILRRSCCKHHFTHSSSGKRK